VLVASDLVIGSRASIKYFTRTLEELLSAQTHDLDKESLPLDALLLLLLRPKSDVFRVLTGRTFVLAFSL
jgi:hypothetical protein